MTSAFNGDTAYSRRMKKVKYMTRPKAKHPQTGTEKEMTPAEFNRFMSEREYPSSVEEEDMERYYRQKRKGCLV